MEDLWDVKRLSGYLSVKPSTIYALIERKEIPHYRIGRLVRFKPNEIDEWLARKMCEISKTNSAAEKILKKMHG